MAGAVVETFVVSEIVKRISNSGRDPEMYFWRTSTGVEVDILVKDQNKFVPIEVKSTSTPNPSMADNILSFYADVGEKAENGYVIHLGELQMPLKPKVMALPFAYL